MTTSLHPPSASNMPDDPADQPNLHVQGYPKLAYFFSHCSHYLYLRRFSGLAVRALLYRQHKLVVLEKKLYALEIGNQSSTDWRRNRLQEDYGYLTDEGFQEAKDVRNLYEEMERELKEYEASLIRFDALGRKSYSQYRLIHVQRWLDHPKGCHMKLRGVDAPLWGSIENPSGHAGDIIQVLDQPEMSIIGAFLQNRFLRWAHKLPSWLQCVLFWSKQQPDMFDQYSRSVRSFENVTLGLGNIFTSLFVYAAVTSLYFSSGKAVNAVAVVVIAFVVTICSIFFKNEQFVVLLTTVCAVLVTLLTNNESRVSQSLNQTPLQ
ncbi:hypothetical protein K491DRAFT_4891 [Lophiostoma macrostomum CBS 122681]|uniref:DUF6594 domain-containing protein n=1 Tax=Lophiostoma macrostomum CBS 122681 TaxID=1314788 RepID=A0A6A6TTT9_9PLEO|nr:hypothetical protein K491DRAFT_4891 [Lophiostoma macrostomum CBS 122681]